MKAPIEQKWKGTHYDFSDGFTKEKYDEIYKAQPELLETAIVSILAKVLYTNNDFRYIRQDVGGIMVNGDTYDCEIRIFKVPKEGKNGE